MVFIVIIIGSFLLQLVLPWWVVIIVSFATCGIIGKTGKISFWQPFLAVSLLWIGMALFKSLPNNNVLATRVAEMLGLQYWPVLVLAMGIVSGLTAGISGLCGYHFRKAMLMGKKAN